MKKKIKYSGIWGMLIWLILLACNSNQNLCIVEFICIDQSGNYISSVEIDLNGKKQKSDILGKCVFQLPIKGSNEMVQVIAKKGGFIFVDSDSVYVEKDLHLKYALSFFRKYELSFYTLKEDNTGNTTAYRGIDIYWAENNLGTTDETGRLKTFIPGNIEGPQRFEARDLSDINKNISEEITFTQDNFSYSTKFVFEKEKKAGDIIPRPKLPERRYVLNIQTKKHSNNRQEILGDIDIFLDGKFIGKTDINGRYTHFIEDNIIGRRRIEAKWISEKKMETQILNLVTNKSSYNANFVFKLKPSPPAKEWKYDPSYVTPQPKLGDNRLSCLFIIKKDTFRISIPPTYKVGDTFNRLIENLNDHANVKRYFKKDNVKTKTWYFVRKREEIKIIDPFKSFSYNKIRKGEVIVIFDKQ